MRSLGLAAALVVGAAVAGFLSYQWWAQVDEAGSPGSVPQVTLPDLTGAQRSLDEWAGNALVVNFWATWCAPCRRELPMLQALQEEHGGSGLQVIGIAIDDLSAVQEFAAELALDFPILVGEQAAIDAMSGFGAQVTALPFTAFVDRNGLVVGVHTGELSREQAEEVLEQIL